MVTLIMTDVHSNMILVWFKSNKKSSVQLQKYVFFALGMS